MCRAFDISESGVSYPKDSPGLFDEPPAKPGTYLIELNYLSSKLCIKVKNSHQIAALYKRLF